MSRPVLVWFRNDLRVADHPALAAAAAAGPVVAVHIEPTESALRVRGAASRWWLHHSLRAHAARLAGLGIRFEALSGPTAQTLFGAAGRHGASGLSAIWPASGALENCSPRMTMLRSRSL